MFLSRPLCMMRSLTKPSIYQRNISFTSRALGSRCYSNMRAAPVMKNAFYKAAGVSALGLGISFYATPTIYCDPRVQEEVPVVCTPPPTPPASEVNLYELSFGTLCGFCAGVFIKKGTKALAFVLGGVFVMLQYLNALSVLRVDWARMGSRFENLFYTVGANGHKRAPTIYSLWTWLVGFLTADFQKRASFIAGLALGLRLG